MVPTTKKSDQELRKRAEEKVREAEITAHDIRSSDELAQLLHELQVFQVELELQNDELRRVQQELEASRARYFDLYNLAPVGYLTLSAEGIIMEANLTSAILLGVDRKGLVKQPFSRFIFSEDHDCYYLHRQQLGKGSDTPQVCELRMMRADGSLFWAHLQTILAQEIDSLPGGYRLVISDCTDQKLIGEQLRLSEEKFRTIADYTYDWEYWLSPNGELLYNSPSSESLTGFPAEKFIADPSLLVSIIYPDDRDLFRQHLEDSSATSREAKHITFRIITKDGDLRWVAHSCQPVFSSQGQFLGRRASNRNITERKLIEERLRLALDASSDGVWDRNLVTNEVFYGENWYKILGYTALEVKEKSLTWEKLLHPDDKSKSMAAVQEHLNGITPLYQSEFRMRNKAGEWQWILSRGKVVEKSDTDAPLRFIGTHTDITRNKNNEIELQKMQFLLEKKIAERTREIEEVNIALKVLLKKIDKDTMELEQKINDNITRLVNPYLQKLQNLNLNPQHRIIVDILAANLQELTSSFTYTSSSQMSKLTPTELQIANLVKHGKNTKEIAALMNLAPGTVSIHRKNIRKKLGISQHKTNLQAYLSATA